jgi:hypothetical protein
MVRQANRKPGKSGFLPRNLLLVFVFTTSLYSFIHDDSRLALRRKSGHPAVPYRLDILNSMEALR